ncbi:unnamed protein product [Hymenolepis diminuta]|uniref:Uncharacterized protein n=1 Tax=Hymenolepis diminuta TaxID=6216 RepID=A0A564YIA8_HYMDI|nr:unnamed protein product [Hymenolepis diminuta]
MFISVLCIAGYRILLFVATAKAFGMKYLSFNFACINTASIFGGILCTFFTIYFPIVQRPDLVLYICASLNAAALILGSFLPDKGNECCQPRIRALKDSREIEISKNFAEE